MNKDLKDQAEAVARCVEDLLTELHREGIPLGLVMAAAHGQVVTMMASIVGGEVAAEQCRSAAERVRPILSASQAALAEAEPKGRA
jgi:ammonia channel protein AmtB